MRILVQLSRIFVAALFLFSGFIKMNDPLGFSYKLQEYFSEGVLNMEFLIPFALALAIFIVIYEVLLGITLILGYLPKFTVWSLLLMIVFFTFLTFYSAYFNKVTDCGCFGDALPLTPWESFTKDVILLVLVLILFFGRKYITPILPTPSHKWIVFVCFAACLGFTYHVLMHLPALDFRAYKIGTNITEGMTVPEGAPEAEFDYNWKFKVNGEEKIITTKGDYPSVEGEFVGVETEEVSAGYEPPIHDFSIERDGQDYTSTFLERDNVILVVMYNLSKSEAEGLEAIKIPMQKAKEQGYDVIGLTASIPSDIAKVKQKHKLDFDFYTTDETALKTILRSNPGIVQLKKGTIVEKLHWNDLQELQLPAVTPGKPLVNFRLRAQLDSIMKLDQAGRGAGDISWEQQEKVDSTNTAFIEKVFTKYGYPGKSLVGVGNASIAAWSVIQHSNKIEKYLPLIKEAGQQGELPFRLVAMMEDRFLMQQNKAQIYGTQGTTRRANTSNPISLIWPIKDAEKVNQRRKEAGFNETVEQYCERLLGVPYKVYTLEEVLKLSN